MSSMLHPRGPRSASVYWRRRAVLFGTLTVVLLLVGWLVFSGMSASDASAQGDDGNQPGPSPSATDPVDPEASPDASPDAAQASPSGSGSPSVQQCQDSEISVVVATDAADYPSGTDPQITMTISSNAESDCLRDIGSGSNEIVITSGGHHVWSSNDCDTSQASSVQVLPPGAKAEVKLTWDRTLSDSDCSGEAGTAAPGAYDVQGSNGAVDSDKVRFALQ